MPKSCERLEVPEDFLLKLNSVVDVESCDVGLALLQHIQVVANIYVPLLSELYQVMKRFQHRNEARKRNHYVDVDEVVETCLRRVNVIMILHHFHNQCPVFVHHPDGWAYHRQPPSLHLP
jgi:hypothetical protein